MVVVVVFFKQKTAYEMRISDWSSDVCSSDLVGRHEAEARPGLRADGAATGVVAGRTQRRRRPGQPPGPVADGAGTDQRGHGGGVVDRLSGRGRALRHGAAAQRRRVGIRRPRSEEHTSELQSLMRISYAVFCLKKKNDI